MMDLFGNPSLLKSNRFETAKLVLMSMGIISTLFLLKVAIIPFTFDLFVTTFPRLWVSARSWLSPPFVYVIVNFIIITIAASSNFHHHKTSPVSDPPPSDPKHIISTTAVTEHAFSDSAHESEPENQGNEPKEEEKEVEEEEEVEVKDSGLSLTKSTPDPSPEKCTNDYISPDADDTLEATWKSIMEGQGKTIKPQLKKSDTWAPRIRKAEPFREKEDGDGDYEDDPVAWAQRELRKSETFNDTASLRREKSMSPEELNKRAEAFIKMFNNQMKLQRLESYQRSMETVNGGV